MERGIARRSRSWAARCVGQKMVWSSKGDGKHRRDIMKSWGLGDDTNAAKNLKMTPQGQGEAENKVELDRQAARTFRGMAARVNYMGQDRSDVHFAAREICTEMSKPTVGGMVRLKRMARYLAGAEKVIWKWELGTKMRR